MENTPRYHYWELSELAEKLGMEEKGLIDRLHKDGYLHGNTQSRSALKQKLFYVDQSASRGTGGLYHKSSSFHIRVTQKGVRHFIALYGAKE